MQANARCIHSWTQSVRPCRHGLHVCMSGPAHMACVRGGLCSRAGALLTGLREHSCGTSTSDPSSPASVLKRECLCSHLSKTSPSWEFLWADPGQVSIPRQMAMAERQSIQTVQAWVMCHPSPPLPPIAWNEERKSGYSCLSKRDRYLEGRMQQTVMPEGSGVLGAQICPKCALT